MLVYEAGEALRFDDISIRAGLRGIIRVMRHLGMLPEIKVAKPLVPVIADSTSWVRAPSSGIVSRKAELGARVLKEQPLAVAAGIVIGRSNLPLAHEGDALFNLAAFKSVSRAENRVEEFTATHTE